MLVERIVSGLRHAVYRSHPFSEGCSGCTDAEATLIELDSRIGAPSKLTCSDADTDWLSLAKDLLSHGGSIK